MLCLVTRVPTALEDLLGADALRCRTVYLRSPGHRDVPCWSDLGRCRVSGASVTRGAAIKPGLQPRGDDSVHPCEELPSADPTCSATSAAQPEPAESSGTARTAADGPRNGKPRESFDGD